jgi:hypothetical protein
MPVKPSLGRIYLNRSGFLKSVRNVVRTDLDSGEPSQPGNQIQAITHSSSAGQRPVGTNQLACSSHVPLAEHPWSKLREDTPDYAGCKDTNCPGPGMGQKA